MKNKELVDSILESMRAEVSQFVEEESKITSALEYEDRVIELSRKFAKGVIAGTQGKMPRSRNLKKSPDQSGTG